jgi:hypothetical protein
MADDDGKILTFPSKLELEDPAECAFACSECDCTFWVIYESNIECAWCHAEWGGEEDEDD